MRTATYHLLLLLTLWMCCMEAKADSTTVELWRQLQRVNVTFRGSQPDSALTKTKELLPAIAATNDHKLQAMAHAMMGISYSDKGEKQAAMEELAQVSEIADSYHFLDEARHPKYNFLYQTMIATYGQLALLCDDLGYGEQCLNYAQKGMKWAGQYDDRGRYAMEVSLLTEMFIKHGGNVTISVPNDSDTSGSVAQSAQTVTTPSASVEATLDSPALEAPSEPVGVAQDTSKQEPIVKTHIEYVPIQNNRIRLVGILFAALLVIFVSYILWQNCTRKKKAQEAKRQADKRYLEGQESERTRLAKELHDGVSNQLLAVEMKLNTDGLTPQTMQLLNESREQVRRVSHELLPPEFEHNTLNQVMADYAEQLNGLIQCEVSYTSTPADTDWTVIPPKIALNIYRIAQEAASNAMKHAGATTISIGLHIEGDNNIVLTVNDNGKKTSDQDDTKGIGYRTMTQRAISIGGKLDIHKHKFGFTVKLTVKRQNVMLE